MTTLALGSVNKKCNIKAGESPYQGAALQPEKYLFSLKREGLELADTFCESFCAASLLRLLSCKPVATRWALHMA